MDNLVDLVSTLGTLTVVNHAFKDHTGNFYTFTNGFLGLLAITGLEKLRREWLMRKIRTVDKDLFPNHWLLGGAFDAPDPNVPGEHRVWELRLLQDIKERYPNESIFKIFLGLTAFIFICDADGAEALLKNNEYNRKNFGYGFLKPWLGDGILISHGEKWKNRRRMLTASFHYSILESFREMMIDCTHDFVHLLKSSNQSTHDFLDLFNNLSLKIICKTAMGVDIDFEDEHSNTYRYDVERIKNTLRIRANNPVYWYEFIWRLTPAGRREQRLISRMNKFTRDIILKRIEEFRKLSQAEVNEINDQYAAGKIKRKLAFLDTLIFAMDMKNDIDLEGLIEETEVFMFAGHDTTTSTLSFALGYITENEQIKKKCLQEINQVLCDNQRPTSEELKNLKYLEACIKETLRLRPPVREWFRAGTGTNLNIKDSAYYLFPESSVFNVTDLIHSDQKHFPNPEVFDPDRFLDPTLKRHPYSFIPFSAGARNCIGQKFAMMELKIVLSTLLRNFDFVPEYETGKLTVASDFVAAPYPKMLIKTSPSQ